MYQATVDCQLFTQTISASVTSRTTSLTSVQHPNFVLRFSDLSVVEAACKEDEEQRSGRVIDWISSRVSKRCARWVDDVESSERQQAEGELREDVTPWWEELRRCAVGDHIPSRFESWNHPTASTLPMSYISYLIHKLNEPSVIFAVSTNIPNPLAAITALHSRQLDLPPWVDPVHLRCTLILHSEKSILSDEESVISAHL